MGLHRDYGRSVTLPSQPYRVRVVPTEIFGVKNLNSKLGTVLVSLIDSRGIQPACSLHSTF